MNNEYDVYQDEQEPITLVRMQTYKCTFMIDETPNDVETLPYIKLEDKDIQSIAGE